MFIAAADTLEHFPNEPRSDPSRPSHQDADLLLVAHESAIEVAEKHGVYSVNARDESLQFVLQKPTVQEMRDHGVFLSSGLVLTDSCFFVSGSLVRDLLGLRRRRGEARCEICCYSDFLRPLGTSPVLNYLSSAGSVGELDEWRREIRLDEWEGINCLQLLKLSASGL